MLSKSGQGGSLLAACGGDTVKIFDVSVEAGDPCTFQYIPSPSCQVNCAKWNHTNLVVASAGDDRKISLWLKNGQSIGTLPQFGNETGDHIDESILSICFSSKGSRYLCSGGTGKVVRVWDLQRKRCIKWLKGHTDTVTGVLYNCKDEHLASISLKGDLILHNLASGTRTTELKDPHDQVLRVLDYSLTSRHILVTAGDDGSLHLWDTTGRFPKTSWLKQHSAPTTGVSFSPLNDKMIMSVGLDKKLYSLDSGMKKAAFCIPFEAPFSSLAFKDDGLVIAAGTNNGRVVFYDVRGKPQPFTILRAYSPLEAVSSLCWQRSKPIIVSEANCSVDAALLGGIGEESVLMPDPLPTSTNLSQCTSSTMATSGQSSGRYVLSTLESSPISVSGLSVGSAPSRTPSGDEGTSANHLWTVGMMTSLQTRNNFSFKDDMEVFSPLVDVQPITPSVSNVWDKREELTKEAIPVDMLSKPPRSSSSTSVSKRFSTIEDYGSESYSSFKTPAKQVDSQNKISPRFGSLHPAISSKIEGVNSVTPPEDWGGDMPFDRVNSRQQSVQNISRLALSGTIDNNNLPSTAAAHDTGSLSISGTTDYLGNLNFSTYLTMRSDIINTDAANHASNGTSSTMGLQNTAQLNPEISSLHTGLPRRHMTYADRKTNLNLSKGSSLGDFSLPNVVSPKQKKTGTENRDENRWSETSLEVKKGSEHLTFLKPDGYSSLMTSTALSSANSESTSQKSTPQSDYNQGPPSFALQLVKRTLEECLSSVQKAIHEDVQNLHLELLRQFHIQQMETGSMMDSLLEKQSELIKEIQSLRRENEHLRQLL